MAFVIDPERRFMCYATCEADNTQLGDLNTDNTPSNAEVQLNYLAGPIRGGYIAH